jgi:hypothetical protein
MRFFSKITFICNCCFVVAVSLLYININNVHKNSGGEAIQLQPIQSTIAILGYGAIILNLVFAIVLTYFFVRRKPKQVPLWQILINLVFIPIQLYYFY